MPKQTKTTRPKEPKQGLEQISKSDTKKKPKLGLVCISFSDEIRFRIITRTRYLALSPEQQEKTLFEIYSANIAMFEKALHFCANRNIQLYRMPSSIFPHADTPDGMRVLKKFSDKLASLGNLANTLSIRVVAHPDQFVVLSSDSLDIIASSVTVLQFHADVFDMMGLSRNAYNAIIIHGGKRGNGEVLKRTVSSLPDAIRSRLTLENDELSYSSDEILQLCNETGLAMIFDAHHHLILEKCADYKDPAIKNALDKARSTWHPHEDWQLVHISNGTTGLHDRRHSDFIEEMPDCFADVEWIEIEARGKEEAIERIRNFWHPMKT